MALRKLVADDLDIWKDCCEVLNDQHYLIPDRIMQRFEIIITNIMQELMEQENGLAPGCIVITRNGPAITCEFDIERLPKEMQSPYEEDERSIITELRKTILSMSILLFAKSHEHSHQTWRISTSTAELHLARDIKQHYPLVNRCWLIMKAVMKAHFYQPKCISSCTLKSVIFDLLQNTPKSWVSSWFRGSVRGSARGSTQYQQWWRARESA